MANELAKQQKNMNTYLDTPVVSGRLSEKLGLEESKRFKAALSSAISTNPTLLTECEPDTVLIAALLGHSLGLPPSPQLGYYYIVPYRHKNDKLKRAQFQIGYKGYIQLAMRSGYYKKLNVTDVKQGEFVSWNPLTEELKANFIENPTEREKAATVGYSGYFEYLNGFTKVVYWTLEQIEIHADKYSKAYSLKQDKLLKAGKIPAGEKWKYSSFWYSDFDVMAKKTVLRQMLSKWGAMSVEMQTAYEQDIKSDSVSFTQAQVTAEQEVENKAGSETIDADFETPKDMSAELEKQVDALKQAEAADSDNPAFVEGL